MNKSDYSQDMTLDNAKYVAFLRGINVGGKSKVGMAELRIALQSIGLTNVKTLLNSGNVVFESTKNDQSELKQAIEQKLEDEFGRQISVIIRPIQRIQQIVDSQPFADIEVTPEVRLYVSFLPENPLSPKLSIPYKSPDMSFDILDVIDGAVFSLLSLTPGKGTPESMAILEKEFGRGITTRNWNTVCKLIKT